MWRYIAQRISGPSKGMFLDWNLPLGDVVITNALGPDWLSATISPELAMTEVEDGLPLLDKWSTAIWAEEDGIIRGGGIVVDNSFNGPVRNIECMGYAGYPKGIPYMGRYSQVGVDPFDVVRHIWDHIQAQPSGNLDMVVDTTVSPIRIGTPVENASTGSASTEGPYELLWWEATDCGAEIDNLAGVAPFEYHESHTWNANGTAIDHRLMLAYPRFGRRRDDLRFVLGENLYSVPIITDEGTKYANEVLGLGTGTGSAMVNKVVAVADHRLRRVAIFTDKSVNTTSRLTAMAQNLLASLSGTLDISSVQVTNHPNAPMGSWQQGDEILIQADTGWIQLSLWCRITSTAISPSDANMAILNLERV